MKNKTKDYVSALLKKGLRSDGRKAEEYRKISIEINSVQQANGSARVKIGETEVIVGVKLSVGVPYPDSQDAGVLITSAELSPIAHDDFEPGPPKSGAIELARVTDRAIRESQTIPFDKLCIKEGEAVWSVFIDIMPVNNAGNLLDAAVIGAMAALKNTVFPEYKDGVINHRVMTKNKLIVSKSPVLCTFGKIGNEIIIDPELQEWEVLDSRISIATLENGTVCAMQKGGEGTMTQSEILKMVELSIKKGKEIRKQIK